MTDSIKCASCGAQSNNFVNCDYCGSFIGVSKKEAFNPEGYMFDGLLHAFADNLKLQKKGAGFVVTNVTVGETMYQACQSNGLHHNQNPSFPGITLLMPVKRDTPEGDRLKAEMEKWDDMLSGFQGNNGIDDYSFDHGTDIEAAAIMLSKLFLVDEVQSAKAHCVTEDFEPPAPVKTANVRAASNEEINSLKQRIRHTEGNVAIPKKLKQIKIAALNAELQKLRHG